MSSTREANPATCKVSIIRMNKKSLNGGLFHDLNIHILKERIRVPTSGTAKAIKRHQVQATRSSAGRFTTNCLSLPKIKLKIF